ncbi:hypothetical protein DFH05DRAFT_1233896 [Lentinula detonsa]|uniref:DDE Tnp4 domain-containing protein n=1 Tax=Lentinula detonsa TaxID=2804962 RepID=A0A9W8NZB2_9AGAR|nr:hypothetical protein DFH05DRAFT_1233896 [Lentinula detonsa]
MLKMGIGYGTVILYCRRVIRAFRELRGQFAAWLNDTEQQESIDSILMNVGFPNCVGSCDGSLVQTYQPSQMGAAYLSRKGFFAVRLHFELIVSCTHTHIVCHSSCCQPWYLVRSLGSWVAWKCYRLPDFQELTLLDSSESIPAKWAVYPCRQRLSIYPIFNTSI